MPMKDIRISTKNLYSDLQESMGMLRSDPHRVIKSREIVDRALTDGNAYYGINTGFGGLASRRISSEQLEKLQKNLIVSHSVGVGDPVPREISRLMLQLKIHTLGIGYSGVSLPVFERLLRLEELDLIPCIPSRGSLGASGDLAPLAHMSLPLIGEGTFWGVDGNPVPARQLLEHHNLEPVSLMAKDGLSLINGTQLMSAYGAWILEQMPHMLALTDLLAAMSIEALQGSINPFDARIHQVRPHPGQALVAENIRFLLQNSEILESHRHCGKVQDPYCLRCVPQVHGATRDAIDHITEVIDREINSVNDNPLVFENGDIISGGNFHGQPLALAMDYAAIAIAELASISERRTYLLLEGHDGLPELLMKETGINSGFMMPQYTAAALVSENKVLCHPASVDSIPSSLGQEDHVSMGSISAVKLLQVFKNVQHVLAIELMTAAQALDFRKPLRPGKGVDLAHRHVRSVIPHVEQDVVYNDYLSLCHNMVTGRDLIRYITGEYGLLN
ncbi:MAG: histidine ammonia-lyase [Balneolaceae bacterium]|nr:MAG: histidine ammonia-lyase [Balneolaceae bacterium]